MLLIRLLDADCVSNQNKDRNTSVHFWKRFVKVSTQVCFFFTTIIDCF